MSKEKDENAGKPEVVADRTNTTDQSTQESLSGPELLELATTFPEGGPVYGEMLQDGSWTFRTPSEAELVQDGEWLSEAIVAAIEATGDVNKVSIDGVTVKDIIDDQLINPNGFFFQADDGVYYARPVIEPFQPPVWYNAVSAALGNPESAVDERQVPPKSETIEPQVDVFTSASPIESLSAIRQDPSLVSDEDAKAAQEKADKIDEDPNSPAGNPVVDVLIAQIRQYEEVMRPTVPNPLAKALAMQVQLYNTLIAIFNLPRTVDFQSAMTQTLTLFREDRTGALEWTKLFRYFAQIPLNEKNANHYKELLNLIVLMAEPNGRKEALKQVDLTASLAAISKEDLRERAANFFRGR